MGKLDVDFSGCSCRLLGYSISLSQSFCVKFPCGFECNNMTNIGFIQDNPIKTELEKGAEMITVNTVGNCTHTHKYQCDPCK